MTKKTSNKKGILNPVTAGVGAAIMASALSISPVQASENPFATQELSSGFMLAGKDHEGKCGEAKCGEGKCGEAKCGGAKSDEGKCGEGKCGGAKSDEGKCGEGKCGGEH